LLFLIQCPPTIHRRLNGCLPEIWALGLRIPWRFSFDRLNRGSLYRDVGQYRYEEIDVNQREQWAVRTYGWRIMEARTNYIVPTGIYKLFGFTLPVASMIISKPMIIQELRNRWLCLPRSSEPRMDGMYFYEDTMVGWFWD